MTSMTRRPSTALVIAGGVLALLSFVLTGVVSRPLLVIGAVLVCVAVFDGQREARRQLTVFAQQNGLVVGLIGVLLVAGIVAWAGEPLYRRHIILGQIEEFSTEGQQLQDEMVRRATASNQLMGDHTAKIEDWRHRLETWVFTDLGPFYKQRLGTPQESQSYPPALPSRFRVFWDVCETDRAALEQFRKEFSSWFF